MDKDYLTRDWQELTKMTGDEPIVVERVKLTNKDIAIEGSFDLPPLAQLTMEDQIFAAAFIQSHGSIKDMEHLFGVSYPTIKTRLKKISDRLDFVDVQNVELTESVVSVEKMKEKKVSVRFDITNTLDQLESGEISVKETLDIIKTQKKLKK